MSQFGETVRWRRKALHMTQEQVATKIRLRHRPTTGRYICGIETGEIDPRLSTVNALARALRIKTWQLLASPGENPFWDDYLCLSPTGKREVQRTIDWIARRNR